MGDIEKTALLVKNILFDHESMLLFKDNDVTIKIENASRVQMELMDRFDIKTRDKQLVISLEMKSSRPYNRFLKNKFKVIDNAIFSFILSLDKFSVKIYDYSDDPYEMPDETGVGIGLPLVIFNLSENCVGFYRVNDGHDMSADASKCVCYDKKQAEEFKKYLEKIMTVQYSNQNNFISEILINVHTINWVNEGFFYTATILFFSCYEYLTNKRTGQQISDLTDKLISLDAREQDILSRFQFLRNAIAHPSDYKIIRNVKIYSISQISKNKTKIFNLDEIAVVRQVLLRLIKYQIDNPRMLNH